MNNVDVMIKAINRKLLSRPDFTVEDAVSEMAAMFRVPWKKLMEEYEQWQTKQTG